MKVGMEMGFLSDQCIFFFCNRKTVWTYTICAWGSFMFVPFFKVIDIPHHTHNDL